MCTVTFIPVRDKIYITSNRDERIYRPRATAPSACQGDQGGIIFPRDGYAGGSWIATLENGNAGVLLNGMRVAHQRKATYTRSRGLVFLDIMHGNKPVQDFLTRDLAGIEPFTLIIWQNATLYACGWDATEKKHVVNLPKYRPYIWSSATLYNEDTRKLRERWFAKWLNEHPAPSANEILDFHQFGGAGDRDNDLVMDRGQGLKTVSITAIQQVGSTNKMIYNDLLSGEKVSAAFLQTKKMVA